MLYGNDAGVFPEAVWRFLKGRRMRIISLDCIHGREAEGSNHMGVPDLITMKQRLLEAGCADENTVFTASHFPTTAGCCTTNLSRR